MDLDGLETTRLEHVDFERIDINSIGQPAPFEYDWNFSSTGAQGWYNSGGIGGSVIWGGSEGDGYIRSEYWSKHERMERHLLLCPSEKLRWSHSEI